MTQMVHPEGCGLPLAAATFTLEPSARVEFGAGAIHELGRSVADTGARRVFVMTDAGLQASGIVDQVLEILRTENLRVTLFDEVEANPSTDCLDRAADRVRTSGDEVVLALGGGSVLDAAKGVALLATNPGSAVRLAADSEQAFDGLPVLAVPTTAGTGAETNGFGVIEDRQAGHKVYIGHPSVQPRHVVLDPELTVGVPPRVTAATGMDALVHGLESLASRRATPVSAGYAQQAISLVSGSLAAAVADGTDLESRSRLLLGAHLAGRALSLSGLGLVHGIAHAVTHRCGAPHGLALSAVVAEVMEHSLADAVPAYAAAARAMGEVTTDDRLAAQAAVSRIRDLADAVGARTTLTALGVDPADLGVLADVALADPVSSNHPRALPAGEVAAILAERTPSKGG